MKNIVAHFSADTMHLSSLILFSCSLNLFSQLHQSLTPQLKRKGTFIVESGDPMALATDNGSQCSADTVTIWLGVVDCRHYLTALSHPCSSGQVKNSIRTLKTTINLISASTFDEIERVVITLLLQYRNARHPVT